MVGSLSLTCSSFSTGTITTESNQVLNSDGSIAIGSRYDVALGPKWGRAEIITGQGTRIVHCNDLLFAALLSPHQCVSINPNSIGEQDGKSYGYASNWSLRQGNSCGCASKINTFLVDPSAAPAVTRLPGLHQMRESFNPYSMSSRDCAVSTDPAMVADAAFTKQLRDENRKPPDRLWEHHGCSFTFQDIEHSCVRRAVFQGYKGNASPINYCHINCHGER